MIRRWMKANHEFSDKVIDILADSLEMPREEVVRRAMRPWGLLAALKGEWPDYGLERERTEIEDRLLAALTILKFVEVFRLKDPEFVRETLTKLILERGKEQQEAQS
jgi:hypothetical protein